MEKSKKTNIRRQTEVLNQDAHSQRWPGNGLAGFFSQLWTATL